MEKRLPPVIIDTDPGIDDAASIFWVLASEKFDVKALTIANGNIGLDGCVTNALRILEVAGRTDVPVYRGAYRPILKGPMDRTAWGMRGSPCPQPRRPRAMAPRRWPGSSGSPRSRSPFWHWPL